MDTEAVDVTMRQAIRSSGLVLAIDGVPDSPNTVSAVRAAQFVCTGPWENILSNRSIVKMAEASAKRKTTPHNNNNKFRRDWRRWRSDYQGWRRNRGGHAREKWHAIGSGSYKRN